VNEAINLCIQHISAYSLSYEKRTVLEKMRNSGKLSEISDNLSAEMFKLLQNKLKNADFEHYEISNYCKSNFHSRHNSGYWQMADYLGVGASAHSFNGEKRSWNIADIEKYCAGIERGEKIFEFEILTPQEKYNDFIFLSLRTKNGIDLQKLKENFGEKPLEYCLSCAKKYLTANKMVLDHNYLKINENAIIISDMIMSDFMQL
ncbi:MAG: coproporphyrinogen III oxidase, partial [Prevotellaceae bacterium]|nr:coproporphyrinogen III oxidase [Prevotellaceae bacterium]